MKQVYVVNPAASSGGGGGGDVNLTEVGGSAISLGPSTMANSLPVVMPASTPGFILSLVNTSSQIKGSAGVLTSFSVSNTTSSARWLKFYDKASAVNPAVDVPVWVEQLPEGPNTGHPNLPAGGLNFTLGIQVRACTGQANADDGAPAANDITLSYSYI